MQRKPGRLIVSVDLDMWWHCRWATGSAKSMWPTVPALLQDHYGSATPTEEASDYTRRVLALFDKHGVTATFFILGQMAEFYPGLIKEIAAGGHEIASHGYLHEDATRLGRDKFIADVGYAKNLLEDLSGRPVRGYRAPNLVLTDWLFDALAELGFDYDSSICPSRRFFGKFADHMDAPNTPYMMPIGGGRTMPELPIPVMPGVKLPSNSGIMTRVAGRWWSQFAINHYRRQGDVTYYFHPYEIGERPHFASESFYLKLFLRNLGKPYQGMLDRIFAAGREAGFVTCGEAAEDCRRAAAVPAVSAS